MSIKVYWLDDDQRIIMQVFDGAWTIEEHLASLNQVREMVASKSHTVHSIADMTKAGRAPARLMLASRAAENQVRPNTGMLFIVNPDRFVGSILRVVRRTLPGLQSHLRIVSSRKQALKMIESAEDGTIYTNA